MDIATTKAISVNGTNTCVMVRWTVLNLDAVARKVPIIAAKSALESNAGLSNIAVDKSPIMDPDGNADDDTDAADSIAPLSPASSDAPSPPPAKLKSFNSNNLIK
mmetsp:Transcript_11410/g.25052  ORF Transcript_11410/g.25052 Transcript_11410/m.25052 type:complete len:105 (+) Transcript_11410:49-363(+)